MSALEKLLGPKEQGEGPRLSPMEQMLQKMLSSIISPEQLQKLGSDVGEMVTWFKTNIEIVRDQNNEILRRLEALENVNGKRDAGSNSERGDGNP